MGALAVLLIILGCAALMYFKGSITKGVATIIVLVCASIVAFGYFELLAGFLTAKGSSSDYPAIVPWAHTIAFSLVFIVAFALLQTVALQLMRHPIDFGLLPERIGRPICGILLGLFASGIILTAAAMAPLPNKYPYQRFDERTPNPAAPEKVLLNADGLVTGWFAMVSKGSFSAILKPKSFATMRAGFLNQLHLNRNTLGDDISLLSRSDSVQVPSKNGAWYLSEAIKDSEGNDVPAKAGHALTVVRIGINRNALKDAGKFTTAQLRLICKPKTALEKPLEGKALAVYPIGYLTTANRLKKKKLNEPITIDSSDYGQNTAQKWIDFAFYVPADHAPVLVGFKLNSLAAVPKPVSDDQALPPVPFVQKAPQKEDSKDSTRPYGTRTRRPSGTSGSRRRGPSDISRNIIGDDFN